MDQLIPVINKLQDVFNTVGGQQRFRIDLPQIVVVGSQSSGKSSVLESLVGCGFLPRNSGICTRRPLVIQMFNTSGQTETTATAPSDSKPDPSQWAEFLHLPGQKFHDFDLVREEIIKETERVAGTNKGISSQAIRLRVFSPQVMTLTLVDLPGIVKIPVGDQPADIDEQTRMMCLEFCANPNAIILAVTAANTDLANSDALQLAQEVDPEGMRTLGVLTKLDLMDDGTDAVEMLSGKVVPLRRGFIGVVNRSQADINLGLDITESLRKESTFFLNHPSYRTFADHLGIQYLARTLNSMLLSHIRDCLPDIKVRINQQLHDVEVNLAALGKSPVSGQGKTEKAALLLKLISQFAKEFSNALDGTGESVEVNELRGGARIRYIFEDVFKVNLSNISALEGLSDADIRTAITNATGAKVALFVPEVSFELLVKHQIQRLEKPSLQCVELVYDELQTVASQCETRELARFVILRERILDAVNELLRENLAPTMDMVSNLLAIEQAYINTSHPDFIGGSRAVAELVGDMTLDDTSSVASRPVTGLGGPLGHGRMNAPPPPTRALDDASNKPVSDSFMSVIFGDRGANPGGLPGRSQSNPVALVDKQQRQQNNLKSVPTNVNSNDMQVSERQKMETEIIKSLMRSYLKITKGHVKDLVPKTIMYFLVNKCKNHIQSDLVSKLYRDDYIDQLLQEDEKVAERRKEYTQLRGTLKEALAILHEVRDFKINQSHYEVYA